MPVDVQNREDQLLGAAWRRCTESLPVGWELDQLVLERIVFTTDRRWVAIAESWTEVPSEQNRRRAYGLTPIEALDALTEALANR